MNAPQLDRQPEESQLVRVSATPSPGAADTPPQAGTRGFIRWLGVLLGLCRDYSAEDISRLKEAGIRIVESKANLKHAEAARVRAAAEKIAAEAMVEREKAHALKSDRRNRDTESAIDRMVAYAEALERVNDAQSRIRQKGGQVVFNDVQMKRIIARALLEYRNDGAIQELEWLVEDENEDGDR